MQVFQNQFGRMADGDAAKLFWYGVKLSSFF